VRGKAQHQFHHCFKYFAHQCDLPHSLRSQSRLTSTVYDCMLCIKRYFVLKPPHGLYKPASQRSLPMRSLQRALMTTFPYLISPVSQRSGAELADTRDIVSWTFTVTSGILYHERFHVYEDEGRHHPWHPSSSLFRPAY
jgi:hypothetical protein